MNVKLRCDGWILRTYCYQLGETLDPDPGPCPKHKLTNVGGCKGCRPHNSWKGRHYRRGVLYGLPGRHRDVPGLIAHLTALIEQGGMTPPEIAKEAGLDPRLITSLLYGYECRLGEYVNSIYAQRILSVKIPDQPRPPKFVDATGAVRRLHAINRAGRSWREIANALGWSYSVVYGWACSGRTTVPDYAADSVAVLYDKWAADPPPRNRVTLGVITTARKSGYLPACAWPGDTIDDPSYNPRKLAECPAGLRRRLRALARQKHGVKTIAAAAAGEDPALIERWMWGKSAPLYAAALIAEMYESLSFTIGTHHMIGAVARREGWPPALAWDDIDDPRAQPHVDAHSDIGKKTLALDSVVYDALDGKIPNADLLPAERRKVVEILHRRFWSDRRIAAWLRWHEDLDKGADNVTKYREREGITGFGFTVLGDPGIEARDGLILWGAAA